LCNIIRSILSVRLKSD